MSSTPAKYNFTSRPVRKAKKGTTDPNSDHILRDISGNVAKVAGYLGFNDTKEFRTWINSDKFWPFYLEYADARNAGESSAASSEEKELSHKIKNVKGTAIYDTARLAEDQGKDYTSDSPNMEVWDGTDHAVRVILLIIEANQDSSPPIIFHPKDMVQEPYYRVWQAVKWVNRVQRRPEIRADTRPTLIPPHMSRIGDAEEDKDHLSKVTAQESAEGVQFSPARWNVYWRNHDDITEEENQHVPPAVMPLPDPRYYEDVRQFRDKIRQIYNLQRLGMDITTLTTHITPAEPPNPYETTIKLRVGHDWARIRGYCETEAPADILWYLVTGRVAAKTRIYETDIPAGIERWLQIKDGVVNQVLDEDREIVAGAQDASNAGQILQEQGRLDAGSDAERSTQIGDDGDRADDETYPKEDIDLSDIDISDRLLLRSIQRQTLLELRNDQDVVRWNQRGSSGEDEERMANLTDLEHAQEENADSIDIKRFWDLEGLKVKAEDVHEYSRACAALAVDPTKPQIVGMAIDSQLKAWQVTGLTWMIAKEKGVVELQHQAGLGEFARTLPCLGGIVACQTGMGKTLQLCALIQEQSNRQTEGEYGATVVLAPPSITGNWAETLQRYFPTLTLIMYHGTNATADGKQWKGIRMLSKHVSGYADGGIAAVAKQYQYLFDKNDPRAGQTVIISSYSTWETRTLTYGPQLVDDHGKKVRNPKDSIFSGVFQRVICDEGHLAKNVSTNTWKSISFAQFSYRWIVTATPLINNKFDLLGLLALLWRDEWQTNLNIELGSRASYQDIFEKYPDDPMDPKCRLALNPKAVRKMMESEDDLEPLRRHLPKVMGQVQLRRSVATVVQNDVGENIPVADEIKPYIIHTVELQHMPDEEVEYQVFHRAQAQIFLARQREAAGKEKHQPLSKTKSSFSFPQQQWRRLGHMTSALRLERLFQERLQKLGKDGTLISEVKRWRKSGKDYRFFIEHTQLPTEPSPTTLAEHLKALTYGAPKLRHLCELVKDIVCDQDKKLLVFVEWPLVQFYLEEFFKALRFKVDSLHSDLTATQRRNVAARFCDTEEQHVEILFCSYKVSSLGINLQTDCSHCVLYEPAINTNTEVQAYGRLHRLGQKDVQRVYRLYIVNSFNGYQEHKMLSKMSGEIAGWDGDIKDEVMKDLLESYRHCSLTDDDMNDPKNYRLAIELTHQALMGQKTSRAHLGQITINYTAVDLWDQVVNGPNV